MMEERKPIQSKWFLIWWVLGLAFVYACCPVSLVIATVFLPGNSPYLLIIILLIGGVFAGILGFAVGYFVYDFNTWNGMDNEPLKRWTLMSIGGGVLGAILGHFLMQGLYTYRPYPLEVERLLWFPVYLTTISVGQWFMLRRQLTGAWLWVFANAVSGLIAIALFTSPLLIHIQDSIIDSVPVPCCTNDAPLHLIILSVMVRIGLAFAPPLALTGGTLLYLFRINQPKDKRKVEDADL